MSRRPSILIPAAATAAATAIAALPDQFRDRTARAVGLSSTAGRSTGPGPCPSATVPPPSPLDAATDNDGIQTLEEIGIALRLSDVDQDLLLDWLTRRDQAINEVALEQVAALLSKLGAEFTDEGTHGAPECSAGLLLAATVLHDLSTTVPYTGIVTLTNTGSTDTDVTDGRRGAAHV